jgi:hypothetical protein
MRISPLLLLLAGCATAPLKSGGPERTASTVLASAPLSPGGEACVTLHCAEDGTCFLVASTAEEGGAHNTEAGSWEEASPRVLHRGTLTARPLPNPTITAQRHCFPQEGELAEWFARKGIDIHAHTLLMLASEHRRIHGGGPRGGAWNAAWRAFKEANDRVNQEEIWHHAMKMIVDFNMRGGQLVPYRSPRCVDLPRPKPPEAPLCDCIP